MDDEERALMERIALAAEVRALAGALRDFDRTSDIAFEVGRKVPYNLREEEQAIVKAMWSRALKIARQEVK